MPESASVTPANPTSPSADRDRSASRGNFARNSRRVILVMLLAVVLYFGFAVWSGLRELGGRLSDYAWWTFAAALGLAFGNYVLRFAKWQYYLRVLDIRGIPTTDSFLTFLSGFVLSVTPGKVGEIFKSLLLWETHAVAPARSAPIVVAERLTDLIGVILLIALGSTRFEGGGTWAIAGSVLVSSLLIVITWKKLSFALIDLLAKLPGPGRTMAPKFREAYESLYQLTVPVHLVLPTVLSVVAWFFECLALWIILRGFGENASVLGSVFFYATSTLAGALVPVPGGLGVTETVMHTLMRQLGSVDTADATGAMLLVRFATLWFAVLVGFVALSLLRRRHPRLLRD